MIEQGVRIHWSYSPHARIEGLGTLDVTLADDTTGAPLRFGNGQLLAWMQRDRAALSSTETPCDVRVKDLVRAGLGRRAEVDLNGYRLMTLNTDGTLAVINPFVGLNNAKLESIVPLGGRPGTWLQVPERAEVWVALDEPAELVAIDMHTRTVARRATLPPGKTVRGIAFDAAGQGMWLAFADEKDVGYLDLGSPDPQQILIASDGARKIVAAARLGGVITLQASGEVTLRRGTAILARWQLQGKPTSAAFSEQAERLIVATEEGAVVWLDPDTQGNTPERVVRVDHGIEDLFLIDGGRRAVLAGGRHASLIDLATGQPLAKVDAPAERPSLLLTSGFLYAVDTRSGRASLWPLSGLRDGRVQALDVMLGGVDPDADTSGARLTRAVASPEGNGVLFASARDGLIFQFTEGMMAPGGSFSNYRRAALALQVLDQSLRSVGPGRYRTAVRHTSGDRYTLALTGVGPRFSACTSVVLPRTLESRAPREGQLHVVMTDHLRSNESPTESRELLRIRLESVRPDGSSKAMSGVGDLTLLLFDRLRAWQLRTALRERGNGEYEADISVPRPARYEAMTSSASQNLTFQEGRIGEVHLGGGP